MPTQRERYVAVRDRLARQDITLTVVHYSRAIVIGEEKAAWEQAAEEAGNPGRWAGIGLEGTRWQDGLLVHMPHSRPVQLLYVRFPHVAGLGREITEAFVAEGFRAEWSGSNLDSIRVYLT